MKRVIAFRKQCVRSILALICFFSISPGAFAADKIVRHSFHTGESLHYTFEDTDSVFLIAELDGTLQAGQGYRIQEIQIPVNIQINSVQGELQRRLTLNSSDVLFRESTPPSGLNNASFQSILKFSKLVPSTITYSYETDAKALSELSTIFAKQYGIDPKLAENLAEQIQNDKGASFLYLKMEDVHQMQASVEKIPEGMLPGQASFTDRHNEDGLGGKFIAAPSQLVYEKVVTLNGVRCAYLKSASLGHEFIQEAAGRKTFTNFTFSFHIALEGPHKGLMILGEGQETATVFSKTDSGAVQEQAILQRQFSIRMN